MSSIRLWHAYLGVLIAPSVLFFALTGCFQLFGLHEAEGAYQPPAIIEKLGKLHKDQVFALAEHHEDGPNNNAADNKDAPEQSNDAKEHAGSIATTFLKVFFLVVGIGLMTSTILGLWMGLTQLRYKRLSRVLLAVGIVLPVVLVVL
jgi:hypothetical protein